MALDTDNIPPFSDTTKVLAEQEPWAVNATERFLKAGASSTQAAAGIASLRAGAASNSVVVEGQWLRRISLIVYGATSGVGSSFGNIPPGSKEKVMAPGAGAAATVAGASRVAIGSEGAQSKRDGIDLSQLRINFRLKKYSKASPNFLEARIYNLSRPPGPDTVGKVKQFGRVQLAAGYEGDNYGMIFDGTVVLYIVGKENPVDSYIDIKAGDEDELNNAAIGLTWPANTTNQKKAEDMIKAAGGSVGKVDLGEYGKQKSLRSSSYIGLLEKGMRSLTNGAGADYYIDDGKHYVIPWDGYVKNEIIELSPTTGLVGIPKVTPQGIEAQCLLNPKLRLGTLVKIDIGSISEIPYLPGSGDSAWAGGPTGNVPNTAYGLFKYPSAAVNPKGIYKILLLEHHGDTRGNTWYSSIVGVGASEDGKILNHSYGGTALQRTRAMGSAPTPDPADPTVQPMMRRRVVR